MTNRSRVVILYTTLTLISVTLCSVTNNKVVHASSSSQNNLHDGETSYAQSSITAHRPKAEARIIENKRKQNRRRKLGKSSKDTSTTSADSINDNWQHAAPIEQQTTVEDRTEVINDIRQELNEHLDKWEEILGHPIYNIDQQQQPSADNGIQNDKNGNNKDVWGGSSSWIAPSNGSGSDGWSSSSTSSSSKSKSRSGKSNKASSSSSSSSRDDTWESGGSWWKAAASHKTFAPTSQKEQTIQPSQKPTPQIEVQPTRRPAIDDIATQDPTLQSSVSPSTQPSYQPSNQPSNEPSELPSLTPSQSPSNIPTNLPSQFPSNQPSNIPSETPSQFPSQLPSIQPSNQPSTNPTISNKPTPLYFPSSNPSISSVPTISSSELPSLSPSDVQLTIEPTNNPTEMITGRPMTDSPTDMPSYSVGPTYDGQTKVSYNYDFLL